MSEAKPTNEYTPEPIRVLITPSLELLRDIAVIGVETPYPGWWSLKHYKWRETSLEAQARVDASEHPGSTMVQRDLPFPEIVFVPSEDVDDFVETTITPEHIRAGMQLVLTPGMISSNTNAYKSTFAALTQDDASHIDAEAADVIIQFGIFGKVVFG